jgi:penicillin-binding protein 1A
VHAEEAVSAHMANLQEEFFIQAKRIKTPFVGISDKETQRILTNAMASNRWSVLKSADKSDEEIIKSFSVKTKMTVFTWKGERTLL